MKIRVVCKVDYVKDELWEEYPNMIDCVVEWRYPVLPREKETVDNLVAFISYEEKKNLQKMTMGEFFEEEYLLKWGSKEDCKKVSVLDFILGYVYRIDCISWQFGEDGIIPCIQVSTKTE